MNVKATLGVLILFACQALAQEHWTLKEMHRYSIWQSLYRTQGLTTDDHGHFWFSSWDSIVMANSKTGLSTFGNIFAIPYSLLKHGCDHIGDISYAAGKVFAPIEDSAHYHHPSIGVYNAKNLHLEKVVGLPWAQQRDGVPWVAASADRGQVYSAEYGAMERINVYDINTLLPMGYIQAAQTLHSVQGAKAIGDYLYMTANGSNSRFSIYKMSLIDGHIAEVAQLPDGLTEVEGLSFVTENGTEKIIILGVIPFHNSTSGFAHKLKQMALFTFALDN